MDEVSVEWAATHHLLMAEIRRHDIATLTTIESVKHLAIGPVWDLLMHRFEIDLWLPLMRGALAWLDGAVDVSTSSALSIHIQRDMLTAPLQLHVHCLWTIYIPLLVWFRCLQCAASRRILIGVAGPAGAGKSTFCAILVEVSKLWSSASKGLAISPIGSLSMDAYHLFNHELRDLGLRNVKGTLPTISASKLLRDLRTLQEMPYKDCSLPIYDRAVTHDPVPDAVSIAADTKIIVVEGLYLARSAAASVHTADWISIERSFDLLLFIQTPLDVCRRRAIARKMRGGLNEDDAAKYFDTNDAPTYHDIQNDMVRSMTAREGDCAVLELAGDAHGAGVASMTFHST